MDIVQNGKQDVGGEETKEEQPKNQQEYAGNIEFLITGCLTQARTTL